MIIYCCWRNCCIFLHYFWVIESDTFFWFSNLSILVHCFLAPARYILCYTNSCLLCVLNICHFVVPSPVLLLLKKKSWVPFQCALFCRKNNAQQDIPEVVKLNNMIIYSAPFLFGIITVFVILLMSRLALRTSRNVD